MRRKSRCCCRHQVETRVRRAIVNESAWRNSNRMKPRRVAPVTSIINTRRQTVIDSSLRILPSFSFFPLPFPFSFILSFCFRTFFFSLLVSTRVFSCSAQRFHSQELRAIKRTCLFMTAPIYLRYQLRSMIIGNGQKLAKLPDQTSSELFCIRSYVPSCIDATYRS